MIHPLRTHYDKLLLVVALAAFGGSADWVRRQHVGGRSSQGGTLVSPAATSYVPAVRRSPLPGGVVWCEPRVKAGHEGWLYEVFNPPLIRLEPDTATFSLLEGEPAGAERDRETPAPVLSSSSAAADRLQLVGYFGLPDNYLVAFRNLQSADTMLVRVGQPIADLGVVLKAFAVRKVLVAETEWGPVHDMVATATVRDMRSQQEIEIDDRAKQPSGMVLVRAERPPEPLRQVDAGRVAADSHLSLP